MLLRFFLMVLGAAALMGCEGRVDMRFAADGTVGATQTILMDDKGCQIAIAEGAHQLKCVRDPADFSDAAGTLNFDPELGRYVKTEDLIPAGTPIEEARKSDKGEWLEIDEAAQIVDLRIERNMFQNLVRGPVSLQEQPSSHLSPALSKAFEGKEVVFVITAAEILESNGEISADRKSVTFRVPVAFVFAGQGSVDYDAFTARLRY